MSKASVTANAPVKIILDFIKEASTIASAPNVSTIESMLIIDGANTIPPNAIGIKLIAYFSAIHVCLKNPHSVHVENIIPVIKVTQFAGIIINKSR